MNGETIEEHNEYHRRYRAENKDRMNVQRRANYKHCTDNQRKAKIARGRAYNDRLYDSDYINVANMRKWVKLQGAGIPCSMCMEDYASEAIHVDHITPLSKGGTNLPDNLQLLCETCNRVKHNH